MGLKHLVLIDLTRDFGCLKITDFFEFSKEDQQLDSLSFIMRAHRTHTVLMATYNLL